MLDGSVLNLCYVIAPYLQKYSTELTAVFCIMFYIINMTFNIPAPNFEFGLFNRKLWVKDRVSLFCGHPVVCCINPFMCENKFLTILQVYTLNIFSEIRLA